ncbi:MAG: YtfJ family protein [Bdellovibrionales bacterium]
MKALLFALLLFPSLAFSWSLDSGNLNGDDWDSSLMKGKAYILFYVSPKKKDLNNDASDKLKEQKFDGDVFGSVAVIDLKSSWIPNSLITRAIKKKQAKYPRTIYLKDKKRFLHESLDFKPSGNDIFAFDKEGKEIFRQAGKLSEEDTQRLIDLLRESIK